MTVIGKEEEEEEEERACDTSSVGDPGDIEIGKPRDKGNMSWDQKAKSKCSTPHIRFFYFTVSISFDHKVARAS